MRKNVRPPGQSRRDFIKAMGSAGTLLYLGANKILSLGRPKQDKPEVPSFEYKYRTVSSDHVPALRDWLTKLDKEKKLSDHKTYRDYIGAFEYGTPKPLPGARSLIILSLPMRIAAVTFHRHGRAHDILIPTGYVDDGITREAIQDRIAREILKNPAGKLEWTTHLPLKSLAVRSGLAEYGKNNITFIEGYGSFHRLVAFYTDQVLEDNWGPLRLLRLCKGCSICLKDCPTRCITEENFVINVGKCLTLHNELPDPIPDFFDPGVHHTLVGCLKCQWNCPADRDGILNVEKLADISEEETRLILNGGQDKALQESITKKLARFPAVQDFAYFSRNVKLAWPNVAGI